MIIYSVTTEVPAALAQQWTEWMKRVHIPQILQTGCFLSARLMREIADSGSADMKYRADYLCPDETVLQRYFSSYAPALRDDFKRNFPEITKVQRTILQQVYTEDC